MLHVHAHGATNPGACRARNEDAFLIDGDLGLHVVCDGLGGHPAGDLASSTACEVIREAIRSEAQTLRAAADAPCAERREAVAKLVESAINAASARLRELARADPARHGMATTVALLVIAGDHAIVAHVGDARVYLHRAGRSHLLTEDHTLINEKVRRGLMSREEADSSPKTGVITRTVGTFEAAQPDILHVEMRPHDRFLLCSDGLSDYFQDDELADRFSALDLRDLPESLIDFANRRGGHDNITAVVVAVSGDLEPGATEAARKLEALDEIPLFQRLSYQERIKVLNVARVLGPGERIMVEGRSEDEMRVSLSGTA